jgi:hypothetical protein
MLMFIAGLLIAGFGLHPILYLVAVVVWALSIFVNFDMHGGFAKL